MGTRFYLPCIAIYTTCQYCMFMNKTTMRLWAFPLQGVNIQFVARGGHALLFSLYCYSIYVCKLPANIACISIGPQWGYRHRLIGFPSLGMRGGHSLFIILVAKSLPSRYLRQSERSCCPAICMCNADFTCSLAPVALMRAVLLYIPLLKIPQFLYSRAYNSATHFLR